MDEESYPGHVDSLTCPVTPAYNMAAMTDVTDGEMEEHFKVQKKKVKVETEIEREGNLYFMKIKILLADLGQYFLA